MSPAKWQPSCVCLNVLRWVRSDKNTPGWNAGVCDSDWLLGCTQSQGEETGKAGIPCPELWSSLTAAWHRWTWTFRKYNSFVISILIKSLRPSDAIWRHRSRTTLVQVMACCLTAPSHYLNQCWLIVSEVQWQSPGSSFIRDILATDH